MKRFFLVTPFFFSLLILSSCAETSTLEKIGMITTVGYDKGEDEKIDTTTLILETDPQSMDSTNVISSRSLTSKGARIESNLKSPKKLASGQLRVALYGEDLAKDGLINLADTLSRDHSISDLTFLAIVEGSAGDLLKHKYSQFSDAGQYVYKEIEQNIKGEVIPSPTLHETLHDYYSIGVDPLLPLLKLEDDMINITGMAILKGDKMVGRISPSDSFYVKLVSDRFKAGNFEITFKNGEKEALMPSLPASTDIAIALDTIKSKSKIELKDQNSLAFNLNIHINARLQEINRDIDLKNNENLELIEKKLRKKITKEIEDLIAYSQSKSSDVFGFGEEYRTKAIHSNLTDDEWHDMFKDIKVKVNTDFVIIRTGVVE
ncbi:Ger(x)C family spore germination protein [Rossellomorea sp. YZS02]|uniref:Ger(x)C family spore germination protein n=1 Tax=Rossellomorea sp. YZS02 TaxID=3097358 RepID=UPI002A10CD05|nr:Ger(x)C family spore germination protein [Rossellomorea sp. YZS02]MDX8342543.1 Ger(x)C family spore germination protein [Rossellomorea sp. YZS02]